MSVFQAVADPTRRALLELLAEGEQPMLALASRFSMSVSAVSQHLKVLREAGLVTDRRDGRQRIYRLQPEPLDELAEWAAHRRDAFWRSKLSALGDVLSKETKT